MHSIVGPLPSPSKVLICGQIRFPCPVRERFPARTPTLHWLDGRPGPMASVNVRCGAARLPAQRRGAKPLGRAPASSSLVRAQLLEMRHEAVSRGLREIQWVLCARLRNGRRLDEGRSMHADSRLRSVSRSLPRRAIAKLPPVMEEPFPCRDPRAVVEGGVRRVPAAGRDWALSHRTARPRNRRCSRRRVRRYSGAKVKRCRK